MAQAVPEAIGTASTAEAKAAGSGLSDIVVTAQKRREDIQHSPVAVTAISGEGLKAMGIVDSASLSKAIPSVQIFDRGSGTNIAIRGVISINAQPQGDPSVAFSVDDVYIARPQSSRSIFFDTNRVEVLRGPQGTVYGRNATAGAINVVSNDPVFRFEGAAGIELGSFDTLGVNGVVNVPLSDTVAVRAAVQTYRHDGYIGKYEDANSFAGRLKVLFQPTDTFSILLTGSHSHQGGKGSGDVAYPYVDADDPWYNSNYPDDYGHRDDNFTTVSGKLVWDLGPAALTYIGTYSRFKQDSRFGQTAALSVGKLSTNQWTNEIRLSSTNESNDAGTLKWLVGLYQFDESVWNIGGISNPVNRKTYGPYALVVENDTYMTSRSIAGFAQGTYSLLDTLRLTAGIRYTEDRKSQSGSQTQTMGTTSTVVPAFGHVKFTNTSYKLSVDADLASHVLGYATVSTGFHSGGLFESATTPNYYQPEELTSYEVGLKSRLFDNRVEINLSGYYYDYKNYQAQVTRRPSVPNIVNAAKAKFKGVELDSTVLVGKNGTLRLSGAFIDAKFQDFCVDSVNYSVTGGVIGTCNGAPGYDLSGYEVPFVSKWAATVGYEQRFPLANLGEIQAGVTSQLRSHFAGSLSADPRAQIKGWTSTDLTLGYYPDNARWNVTAYVRNLEDGANATWSGPTAGRFNRILSAPRRFGATFDVKF